MGNHFNEDLYVRPLEPGMGEAVARRTFLRKKCVCGWAGWGSEQTCPGCRADLRNAEFETWGDLASRVALGNCLIHPTGHRDLVGLERDIACGLTLMSGRHLQHGDETQPGRSMEVFTNCATACTSFVKFYLLLNGSGVGRCYDDDLMLVDWAQAPDVYCVLGRAHPDFQPEFDVDNVALREGFVWVDVEDSREGWAKAIEWYETVAWRRQQCQLILDFTGVRPRGAAIRGMQGRPSAGPVPTMRAIMQIAQTVVAGARRNPEFWPRWKQAMYVDHFLADCVHLGGARRAARNAVKHWRDPGILDFITVKHALDDGDLWTANNSVGLDDEFYQALAVGDPWATKVAQAISAANYYGNRVGKVKGEPGAENEHLRVTAACGVNDRGLRKVGSEKFPLSEDGQALNEACQQVLGGKRWVYMPNPCYEILLWKGGGFCVVSDLAPYHAITAAEPCGQPVQDKVEAAARRIVRALIRVNLLPSVYQDEVRRTNRIGVSLTGLHEYAWQRFGLSFHDLLDEHGRGAPFWQSLAAVKRTIQTEARKYSAEVGLPEPHTNTTIKPAGSVSKPFGLTEGAHLPAYADYLRWVQYQADDSQVLAYEHAGYPVMRNVRSYESQALVGFPTRPLIVRLGIGDKLVTAGQATMDEQYQWLRLLEKYWIVGVTEDGQPLENRGNAISYTLKYDPRELTCEEFHAALWRNQGTVRCCAVMPQEDVSSYPYQPEEPLPPGRYEELMARIRPMREDVTDRDLACATGACPL